MFILQSGLSARERRRLKQKQKGDNSSILTPPAVAVLPSPNEVIAAKVRRSQEGHVGGRPTETGRFAYESFRFKKRNERYACIYNRILSATHQAKAVTGNWPNTLAKRLVGEATVPEQPLCVIFNCMGNFGLPHSKECSAWKRNEYLQSECYILYVDLSGDCSDIIARSRNQSVNTSIN